MSDKCLKMKKIIVFMILCLFLGVVSAQNSDVLLKKLVEKNILTQSEAEELKSSAKEEKK
jgi:signal transduction histidine kinase